MLPVSHPTSNEHGSIALETANSISALMFARTPHEVLRSYFLTAWRFIPATYYGFQLPNAPKMKNIFSDSDFELQNKWDFTVSSRTTLYICGRPTANDSETDVFWSTCASPDTFILQNRPDYAASIPLLYDDQQQLGTLYFFRYGGEAFTRAEQHVMRFLASNVSAALYHAQDRYMMSETLRFHADVHQKSLLSFLITDKKGDILYENSRSQKGRQLLADGELPKYLTALRKNVNNIVNKGFAESVSRYDALWRDGHNTFLLQSYLMEDQENILTIVKKEDRKSPMLDLRCGLTSKENEITTLLSKGKNTAAIAKELCLSENTVKVHVQRIYQKLGVRSRGELLALLYYSKK